MNVFYSGLIERKEMEGLIQGTDIGLETIQFSVSDNLDHFQETLKKEKEVLECLDYPRLTIHGPFMDMNPMSYDSCIQQVTMDRFNQAWEAAICLGAEKIVYHSGMIPTVYYLEGWAERMADFWNRFLDHKPADGPAVCMENVLDRKAQPFLDVCRQVKYPNFGICLDVGHVNCYSEDSIETWLELLKGRIRHVHVHDNDGVRDLHRAVGKGTVNWEAVLQELVRYNKNLTWTIECAEAGSLESSRQYLENNLAFENM